MDHRSHSHLHSWGTKSASQTLEKDCVREEEPTTLKMVYPVKLENLGVMVENLLYLYLK